MSYLTIRRDAREVATKKIARVNMSTGKYKTDDIPAAPGLYGSCCSPGVMIENVRDYGFVLTIEIGLYTIRKNGESYHSNVYNPPLAKRTGRSQLSV
jgi:hypothetical protein